MGASTSSHDDKCEMRRFVINYVGEDWHDPDFRDLVRPYRRLSAAKRRSLLRRANQAIAAAANNEELDVATYVLIALYPDSSQSMRDIMGRRIGKKIFHVHFLLFFQFWFFHCTLSRKFKRDIETWTEEYLMSVKRDTAGATWMARDLLGEDWDIQRALPIFVRVARNARFANGRAAGVCGLRDIAQRTKSLDLRNDIFELMDEIAKSDRSNEVRFTAALHKKLAMESCATVT